MASPAIASPAVLLFLDVDGVLNSGETRDREPEPTAEHDLAAAATSAFPQPPPSHKVLRLLRRVFKSGSSAHKGQPSLPVAKTPRPSHLPAAALVANLKRVVDATGASIVLSTTWRCTEPHASLLRLALKRVGLTAVGSTLDFEGAMRGDRADEILDYVRQARADRAGAAAMVYVAVDDMDLTGMNSKLTSEHFVRTSDAVGLSDDKVAETIEKLRRQTAAARGPI